MTGGPISRLKLWLTRNATKRDMPSRATSTAQATSSHEEPAILRSDDVARNEQLQEPRHMSRIREARFQIGQVVRHRFYPFRGVVFDVDPVFDNTEDWWLSIPEEIRPTKDQPYYHLLAENDETEYVAYVSEQNLLADDTGEPVRHPQVSEFFADYANGQYRSVYVQEH